ncbi:MAG: DUF3426 domain-containing protein [Pseudomonadota bacterium]
MQTSCPACQTRFYIRPEQLKARAGTVRCGQCHTLFNALDHLRDSPTTGNAQGAAEPQQAVHTAQTPHTPHTAQIATTDAPAPQSTALSSTPSAPAAPDLSARVAPPSSSKSAAEPSHHAAPRAPIPPTSTPTVSASVDASPAVPGASAASTTPSSAPSAADELLLPRETNQIAGYSRWNEHTLRDFDANAPSLSAASRQQTTGFFVALAALLALLLLGQSVFYFRSELLFYAPRLRPTFEAMARVFAFTIPLPMQIEQLSIDSSDLQIDPEHGERLSLQATLRNRAAYAQAYPLLELSLTDTEDKVIARRVFRAQEYLPANATGTPAFAANQELALRLSIEARNIQAAGYRLYIFYP